MVQKSVFILWLVLCLLFFGCKISGTVTDITDSGNPVPLEGVSITLNRATYGQIITDSEGAYNFDPVTPGTYTVTPSLSGYKFIPESREIYIDRKDINGIDGVVFDAEATDPDGPGSYRIGYYNIQYTVKPHGTYGAKIRYPAKYDGENAPKLETGEIFPAITLTNGYGLYEWQLNWIPKHLTSQGFITICFNPPFPFLPDNKIWSAGHDGAILTLKEENARDNSPIYKLLNTKKFGIFGFSMGGGGTLHAMGNNPEVSAGVVLAPAVYGIPPDSLYEAIEEIDIPVMLQAGTCDGVLSWAQDDIWNKVNKIGEMAIWDALDSRFGGGEEPFNDLLGMFGIGLVSFDVYSYFESIPTTTVKQYIEIDGANHLGFLDEGFQDGGIFYEVYKIFDKPAEISVKEQHAISKKYFTAWFQYFLNGYSDYYTDLPCLEDEGLTVCESTL